MPERRTVGRRADAETVVLRGAGEVRPEHVAAVAEGVRIELDAAVVARMSEERAALDVAIAGGAAVYGVTHGLGARSDQAVTTPSPHEFAAQTVRGRAHAVGPPLAATAVRAAIASRLSTFAAGGSGVSPHVAEGLAALVNAGVTPVIGSIGSIGLSDLCQFAHVGLVVLGEGRATSNGSTGVLDGGRALQQAGLAPLVLAAKDGLTLCGGNPIAIGAGCLAVVRVERLAGWAEGLLALSMRGFGANSHPLRPDVLAMRGNPALDRAARALRSMTAPAGEAPPRRLQDPVSFRSAPVSLAALDEAVGRLRVEVTAELNGSGDNPVVVGDDVLPTGNFHAPMLAQASDGLAIALAAYANSVVSRCQRLLQPRLTELPANLVGAGPNSSGLAPLIKIAQSLVVQLHRQAAPLSFDARDGADGVEDDGSNTSAAALRLLDMGDAMAALLAVEAVFAAQAVDLRGPVLAPTLADLHQRVRRISPVLGEDRSLAEELEALAAMIAETAAPASQR
ncbi:MAG: histidine ammonia-lyase [Nocardioidaceae bacterium]|nr:histidine ammonia-lyase [Nocardioidaceae bacterium]